MKLIDEKLVEEAAKKYAIKQIEVLNIKYDRDIDKDIDIIASTDDFIAGASFAEQQLKQKMIEAIDYSSDFICYFLKGQNLWLSKKDYKTVKTTEQLLEEFINQQK